MDKFGNSNTIIKKFIKEEYIKKDSITYAVFNKINLDFVMVLMAIGFYNFIL